MRKIIDYFIKYHVAVNIVILAFLLFGTIGVLSLKSSFFPLSESRIIQISAIYPGASPLEMEEGVVLKIEDNLKGLIGVERVTSVSRENSGNITVENTLVTKGNSIVINNLSYVKVIAGNEIEKTELILVSTDIN